MCRTFGFICITSCNSFQYFQCTFTKTISFCFAFSSCNAFMSTDMTMEEVREYERATQEATNLKIGSFPPAISISDTPLPSTTRGGPNSAPSTPLTTEAPDFLAVPKDRPRKKSAPETLTLPDPGRRDSLFKLPSFFSWNSSPQPE